MAVTIRGKTLALPIVQGGMGIGVSLERLAGAVAAQGGMGTVSAAFGGFREPDFRTNSREANLRALTRQVGRAKEIAKGAGLVAVNVMVAAAQYRQRSDRPSRRSGRRGLRRGIAQGPARPGGGGSGK